MTLPKSTLLVLVAAILLPSLGHASTLPPDFTEDFTLPATPSVVDVFDRMVWSNYAFTVDSAHTHGDGNGDGVVDGSDYLLWNVDKFKHDPVGGCGTAPCVPDATVASRLASVNGLDFTPHPLAPIFTLVDAGPVDELRVTIQPATNLVAFTVTGPAPLSIATRFQTGLFPAGFPFEHNAETAYFDGRQQWFALGEVGNFFGGFGPVTNELVATYPDGTFPSGAPVIYQAIEPAARNGGQQFFTGSLNVVPEPLLGSVGVMVMLLMATLLSARSKMTRSVAGCRLRNRGG